MERTEGMLVVWGTLRGCPSLLQSYATLRALNAVGHLQVSLEVLDRFVKGEGPVVWSIILIADGGDAEGAIDSELPCLGC